MAEQVVSYVKVLQAIAEWKAHACRLERERDEARAAALTAQLEAAALRDELRRLGHCG